MPPGQSQLILDLLAKSVEKFKTYENEKQREDKLRIKDQKLMKAAPDPVTAAVVCNHLDQVFILSPHISYFCLFHVPGINN